MSLVEELLILLLASIPIAFLSTRLRQPVIVGFMITGIIIGPYGLGLVSEVEAVEALAEIGVVLLLFTIGLEFSLQRMMEMRKLVLVGGGLQVAITIASVAALFFLLGRRTPALSTYFGFLFALSSTAIVLKAYLDRAEIDTPYGKAAVGILIFQDLCIVPLMLFVPILSGREGSSISNIALRMGTAVAVIAGIIFTARKLVPLLLHQIVRLRSGEVFIIFVVLVAFGTAWLTSKFGLSMALGAFIAGVVLSESEYSHQIVSDFIPFRDVFNSIFFISIGMLLSVGFLISHLPKVLIWVLTILVGKALIVFLVAKLLGLSLRIALTVGIGLAQVGEFSFILAKVGVEQGLLAQDDYQSFLASSILSMIVTPFLISVAPSIAVAVQRKLSPRSSIDTGEDADEVGRDLNQHAIIVGYGNNGRNLARVLYRVGIPFIVLELNADAVQAARKQGVPIFYADAVRREVLSHFALGRAQVLVIAISDPIATRHVVALAREINPRVHIIVRTRYISQVADLMQLGATQVVPEEFETSIEIFSRVLREYGVSRNVIAREIDEIRSENYQMLRESSMPLAELEKIAEAFASSSTETVFINAKSAAVGRTLKELDLRGQTGVTVTAAVRDGNTEINLGPDFRVEADDILVLLGRPDQLEEAMALIEQPGELTHVSESV